MTVEELFSVQADLNKLKSLSMELANLEEFNPYRNNIISDMPKGSGGKDLAELYIEEKERIEGEIELCKMKIREDRKRVKAFIEAAPYPEQDIIRFRVINELSWDEIGNELGMDRRSASRKFQRYIKLSHDARDSRCNTDSGMI